MLSLASLRARMAALPEPLRIGIGLGLGFLVTLTMVVAVMIVGFSYMAKIEADMEQITQVNNVKTDLAHTMKYMQRERSVSLYALASMDDMVEKDEELRRFDSKGAEWWRAWQKLQAFGLNQQEQVLADRINKLARERNLVLLNAIDIATTKHGTSVSEYMRKAAIPGQMLVSHEIDSLLTLQKELAIQATANAAESYTKTRLLLIWLCGLTIATGILVATVVMKRVMRQSRELEYKALFDGLTGLPNRTLFFDRLHQAAKVYQSVQTPFSVVLIDLDRFKYVNDTMGHHVGDMLLKHVALNISSVMRRTDTVARLGGDEFVILLPGSTAATAEVIIKKLLASLCHHVNLGGNVVDIACSMGIASFPEHDDDITRLLLKADVAMYAAKRANVGWRIYTQELESLGVRNIELQNELRNAIEHDQLQLYYQPKISHHTGNIMGVEALHMFDDVLRHKAL